jgi:dTDP-4-dehydrorhamnose 3,5-epimerase
VIFHATPLAGVHVLELQPATDPRGFFARTFDAEEFERRGLCRAWAQCSTSYNTAAGTLRGLHYQAEPHAETKLVRVTGGAIFDVVVDLRRDSPTFRRWFGVELSADNRKQLYIPPGFAHGFQTLTPGAEVLYQITPAYVPSAARGVRWDDPAFAIDWPAADQRILSDRDRAYPNYT